VCVRVVPDSSDHEQIRRYRSYLSDGSANGAMVPRCHRLEWWDGSVDRITLFTHLPDSARCCEMLYRQTGGHAAGVARPWDAEKFVDVGKLYDAIHWAVCTRISCVTSSNPTITHANSNLTACSRPSTATRRPSTDPDPTKSEAFIIAQAERTRAALFATHGRWVIRARRGSAQREGRGRSC
jgi:hypothetical protein